MGQAFTTTTVSAIVLVGLTMVLGSACSSEPRAVDLGRESNENGFVGPEAGVDGDVDPDILGQRSLCIATECPAPFATCATSHKCGVDLSSDVMNCGSCGYECPSYFQPLHVRPFCSGGKCRYSCDEIQYLDCNDLVDDGCEVDKWSDPNNCGACGHACDPGVRCFRGVCGCPDGYTDCNGTCVDLKRDRDNCSACGVRCPNWWDEGWPEPFPNMDYGCFEGECGHMGCNFGFADCDNDIDPNGCETPVLEDTNNCGGCGIQCAEGQICGFQWGMVVPTCLCPSGLESCPLGVGGPYECVDLLSDLYHCGTCTNECVDIEINTPHTVGACIQGQCKPKCVEGFADCDGDPTNGCEVNLKADGSNCGACGHWCNTGAGQPCIDGVCLTRDCDAGVETR